MQIVKTFEIKNQLGIHARAAAKIVEIANLFNSDVFLEKDGCAVDGRSILDILTIYCPKGCSLTVRFKGPDADKAMKMMSDLIENKFGEP